MGITILVPIFALSAVAFLGALFLAGLARWREPFGKVLAIGSAVALLLLVAVFVVIVAAVAITVQSGSMG